MSISTAFLYLIFRRQGVNPRSLLDLSRLSVDHLSDGYELLAQFRFVIFRFTRVVDHPIPFRESLRWTELTVAELRKPSLDPDADVLS